MPVIHDDTLGKVTIRRSTRSKHITMRVAPDGSLRVSAPMYTPLFLIKRSIASSRGELANLLHQQRPQLQYSDGDQVGKSHSITVRQGGSVNIERQALRIIVTLTADADIQSPDVQALLREQVIAALRREAKGYLPKRLRYLADQHGFSFQRVRFSHASGRWGSCSSNGTISLNIALMKLPFELIDYVLIHELAHTKQMNHSDAFWSIVSEYDPHYKAHRTRLKREAPTV